MFGLGSARGRAILAGAVLVVLLAGVAALAVWRTQDHQQRLTELERTSVTATALEHGRAQFFEAAAATSGLMLTQDPALAERYQLATAELRQDLSQARAEMIASGNVDNLVALDALTERIEALQAEIEAAMPIFLAGEHETILALASTRYPELWPTLVATMNDLEALAETEESKLAVSRVDADQAADTTLWLVIGFGAAALLVATGILAVTTASVVRPLLSFRAKARAIAAGDLQVRAKISGPEEIASLARDFNEMTDALCAKTEEYVASANLTGDIVGRADEEGRWIFLNDAACQFLGRPREELLGTDARASLHPEDLEPTVRAVEEARDRKKPIRGFVNRQLTPMGTRVVEWNAYPLFDAEGRYAGIQMTGRDITERKRAEEALRTERDKSEGVIASLSDGLDVVSQDYRVHFQNKVLKDRFGDLTGKLCYEGYMARETPCESCPMEKAIATGSRQTVETTRADGREYEVTSTPFQDIDGETKVIEIVRDITERKRAEEALRESEGRFRTLSEATTEGIVIHRRGRILGANQTFARMLGYELSEIIGMHALDFAAPESRDLVWQSIVSGREEPFEAVGLRKDGSTFPAEICGKALPYEERMVTVTAIRDITEHKRAEEALHESEKRYRLLAENASDVIWTLDMNLKYTYVSPSFTRMRGYTTQEMLNSTARDTLTPASLQRATKVLAEELAIERTAHKDLLRSRTLELEVVCRDGSTVWTEAKVTFVRDQEGQPVGILGVSRDITDRKRAEEALRRSEEEFRLVFEHAKDAVFWADPATGLITRCNKAAENLLEKKAQEIVGQPQTAVHPPEKAEYYAEMFKSHIEQEGSADEEAEVVTKSGRMVPVHITASVVSVGGRPIIQGVFRDITERKRAEEALRESEERFRSLSASAPIGIFLTNAQGKCTYANPRLLDIAGLTLEESLGYGWSKVIHPDDREAIMEEANKAAGQGHDLSHDVRILTRDGQLHWAHVHTTPTFSTEGKVIGRVGALEDITERKRAEEALRESEGRYRLLAENASDLIWTMDMSLHYTYVSPSITRMRGYTVEEVMTQTVNESMTPASRELAVKTLAEELAIERTEHPDLSRSRTLELEMNCKDGSTLWCEMKMTFLRDSDGKPIGILGVTRDISERKKAEEERERLHAELELRAITDSLTGLYDHAYFYTRLAEEMERSKRYNHGFVVMMMDVDDFKRLNDSRGYQAGDEMLRLVADCIRAGLRRSDLAFRYGGDEFAAILPHADSSKARAAVNRINRRIARSLKQMDGESGARLSLSAGIACFPDDATAGDDLVRIADAALYSTKWVARARDIMGQREDIQSLVSALVSRQAGLEGPADQVMFRPEALHEQHARIVSSVASSIVVALRDAGVSQALEDPDLQIIAVVGAAAEIKDRYIRGHPERTSEWAVALAEEMGFSPERARDVRIAGLLHDIGKVTVSEGILNKPGKLMRREFASIKEHPIVGATLVSQVKGFQRLVPIIRHHHERFDGSGYPDGLGGEQIPLEARILSVADVFDAMTHERSYRKALSRAEAIAQLGSLADTQFDPRVVEAFLALLRRRDAELATPAQAASGDGQRATARAAGRGEGLDDGATTGAETARGR